jgi:putative toxin-antitoxin system antitoxin component (TIGR02293 family)
MSAALVSFVPLNPAFAFDWKAVEQGVPLSLLDQFSAYSGLPLKLLLEVVIPARTLKHRKQRKEPLSTEEADRLRRVARAYDLSLKVMGDPESARAWLTSQMGRFDGRTPFTLLRTQAGEEAVQEALVQLDEGMVV